MSGPGAECPAGRLKCLDSDFGRMTGSLRFGRSADVRLRGMANSVFQSRHRIEIFCNSLEQVPCRLLGPPGAHGTPPAVHTFTVAGTPAREAARRSPSGLHATHS